MYKSNPSLKQKDIARITGASYGYVRKVISRWRREQVTSRGGPRGPWLPVGVHGVWFRQEVPVEDYVRCPLPVSGNRNRQKVFWGRFVRAIFFPSGVVVVYPLGFGWREELRSWLLSWMGDEGYVDLFLDGLASGGEYHIASWIPPGFMPKQLSFRVKGLGRFHVDKTPFKDTLEFQVDPELLRLRDEMQRLERAFAYQAEVLREYAEQLSLHLAVMRELKKAVDELGGIVKELKRVLGESKHI